LFVRHDIETMPSLKQRPADGDGAQVDRIDPRSCSAPTGGTLRVKDAFSNRSQCNALKPLTFRSSRERLLVVTAGSSSLHPEMALRTSTAVNEHRDARSSRKADKKAGPAA
jgi:hypothetical protein